MSRTRLSLSLVLALLHLSACHAARAAVGLENHLGDRIPIESIPMKDELAADVTISKYFHAKRPVLLVPVFFGCPSVCVATLGSLTNTLKRIEATAGRGYEVVVFSIDPEDLPAQAREEKKSYLERYGRPESTAGWHFLTGKQEDIVRLTRALGFQFEKLPEGRIFSHPAAVFVLSPDGTLSQVLNGSKYTRKAMLSALFNSNHGNVQKILERARELCGLYLSHTSWLHVWIRKLQTQLD